MLRFVFMNRFTKIPGCSLLMDVLDTVQIDKSSKLLYPRLLKCILTDGKPDENGRFFVRYPIRDIALDIDKSEMTVKRCLRSLEDAGLIIRVRERVGVPNMIYVLIPERADD